MIAEYSTYDALALRELVRVKQITPRELLETAIQLAEKYNPDINAITYLHKNIPDISRDNSETMAFWGVPFLIKDMGTAVKGMPSTYGSKLLQGNVWNYDAEIVTRYKAAGLQIFGLTNVPEFGICVSCESQFSGPVKNPYHLGKTAGGSSGGAAAAVAAGIVPVANGSDGGGSIRIPASCCGVFGLKPTRGRNPMGPKRSEGWGGLTAEHVISRSVRDCAAFLDATQGADVGAYYYAPPPERTYLEETKIKPPTLNIGYFKKINDAQLLQPECEKALLKTLKLLEEQGHQITEINLDVDVEKVRGYIIDIIACQVTCMLNDIARSKKIPTEHILPLIEPVSRQFYELGMQKGFEDYIRAINNIHGFSREFTGDMLPYDILVSPTLAEEPVDLGYLSMDCEDFSEYLHRQNRFSPYTAIFNYTGQPAASIPIHFSENGLPVGVQLIAPYAREDLLFRVCASLEPHFQKRKPAVLAG